MDPLSVSNHIESEQLVSSLRNPAKHRLPFALSALPLPPTSIERLGDQMILFQLVVYFGLATKRCRTYAAK